jgi:hypothetical protein
MDGNHLGKIELPPDHKAGMKVPKGGSMCANCRYLKDAEKRICSNEYFIKWNGSEVIPGEVNAYCSDWYEPGKSSHRWISRS